MDPAGSRQKAN